MLEDSDFNFLAAEHADRLSSSNVGRGDIVLTHRGNIGQVSYIPEHSAYERYVVSQSQFFLRCNLSRISPIFSVNRVRIIAP
jgi:type I restriction enzyme S subunit